MLICSSCHETDPSLPTITQWRKNGLIRRAGKKVVQRYQCQHCGFNTTSDIQGDPIVQTE